MMKCQKKTLLLHCLYNYWFCYENEKEKMTKFIEAELKSESETELESDIELELKSDTEWL